MLTKRTKANQKLGRKNATGFSKTKLAQGLHWAKFETSQALKNRSPGLRGDNSEKGKGGKI